MKFDFIHTYIWRFPLSYIFFACSLQTWYLSRLSRIIFVEKKLSCGEISAFHVWQLWGNWKFLHMWRNFRCLHMTDVEKSEILHIWHVCDVENVAIYAKFMQFYALSCGEKLSPTVHLWRKKWQIWGLCERRCSGLTGWMVNR